MITMENEQKQSLLKLRDYKTKEEVNAHVKEIFEALNITPNKGEEDFWVKAKEVEDKDPEAGIRIMELGTLWHSVPYQEGTGLKDETKIGTQQVF